MTRSKLASLLAIALIAAPAAARELPERGVSREQMVEIMKNHGLPARIDKDDRGQVIVRSRVAGYWKPNKVIWAEQDAIVGRGTTENIDDYLSTWESAITTFKQFMKL